MGGVHLCLDASRETAVDALRHAVTASGRGGPATVEALLADLDRTARRVRVPAPAVEEGFAWDRADATSRRWWPQGITTSADAGDPHADTVAGRRLVLTSWYSRDADGANQGARVTVLDVTEPARPRYRHVLLVEPFLTDAGTVDVRPLRVHAGGLVWHRDHLLVAATARGICAFRLADLLRVEDGGHRYWLPLRLAYDGRAEAGHERLRHSFLSLGRGREGTRLVAGEYGRRGRSTRLLEYALDPATGLPVTGADGHVHPLASPGSGPDGMQGATVVDDTWYVTTSAGRYRRGSLHVGRPGELRRHRGVLPVGVEDVAYWPAEDRLWSLSEHPGRRYVFTVRRPRLQR